MYRFAGILLLVSGFSHMSQILIYEPSAVVKVASAFGVLYAVLGAASFFSVRWLPWLIVPVCLVGLAAGTSRLLSGTFNLQLVVHQLIHLIVISLFLVVIIRRRKTI